MRLLSLPVDTLQSTKHENLSYAYASGLSAAKKRFALSEETDLEATTEESIECVSSSDPEKSKKDEAIGNDGKVKY